jgi:hypothetical protein
MLARAILAATIAFAVACTLTTDFDGLSGGPADAAPPKKDAPAADARVVLPNPDGGAPIVTLCSNDLTTDSKNCGVCMHDCLGGACVASRCQTKVVLNGVFNHPLGVALSASRVYVGDANTINECTFDGSECKTVVSGVQAHYLFTTPTDLYFTDGLAKQVKRWSLANGGDPAELTDPTDNLEGVAVSDTSVFFNRYTTLVAGGGVYSMPIGGGAPTLFKAWNHPEGLTYANDKVYLGSDNTNSADELEADGTTKELLVGGGPTGVAVVGDDAYITRQAAGEVDHVKISTGDIDVLARNLGAPSGIAVQAGVVYWVEDRPGNLDLIVP